MKKLFDLSLIIPAYNEEKKIEKDIREAFKFLKKANIKSEIIVSTDGVTDQTNNIVKRMQEEFKELKLLADKKKIGKGAAIQKGVKIATGTYIMFADAGLCVPFKFIKAGIKKIEEGYDIALASRASKKSVIIKVQPLYRKIGSKIFGILVRQIIGVPQNIKDTQCGFKIYKNEVAKKLFNNLQSESFMFDIEIILRAKKERYKIGQFPVQWNNDSDTKFNPISGSLKNFKDLYKIKFLYKL
jgi:dolichyl-phosphate beta-glucosyltransferase